MIYLDERAGKVQPPDLWAPDIPEDCPWCGAELELDEFGLCEACGERVEP